MHKKNKKSHKKYFDILFIPLILAVLFKEIALRILYFFIEMNIIVVIALLGFTVLYFYSGWRATKKFGSPIFTAASVGAGVAVLNINMVLIAKSIPDPFWLAVHLSSGLTHMLIGAVVAAIGSYVAKSKNKFP